MRRNCLDYPVEFTVDAFGSSPALADIIHSLGEGKPPRVLIVADMNVVEHTEGLGTKIGRYVKEHGLVLAASPVVISGGEKIKADNLQSAIKIVAAAMSAGIGREDCILALGGGTLLDIAGYAASQLMGGIRLVRVPTTPSSITGGAFATYAAVDSLRVKDALRVTSTPAAVLIDPSFARTVLDGVWYGGISEAVRYAAANDKTLLKLIGSLAKEYRSRDLDAFEKIAKATAASREKGRYSEPGEWLSGRLETMSGYKLPRGYALGIATEVESRYALERGWIGEKDVETIHRALKDTGALDGLRFSGYLLGQPRELIDGLKVWKQFAVGQTRDVFHGLGKCETETEADVAAYEKAIASLKPIHKEG